MRRNSFFDLYANIFGVIVGFFLVDQKSESINRFIHDVNHNFHYIWFLKISILILKRAKPMSNWFDFINEINDDLS